MLYMLMLTVCIGAGIIGGVFFAFSVFIMRALAALPPHQGMAAMQLINRTVLTPLFLGVFMGAGVLSALSVAVAAWSWGAPWSRWLMAAGLLYVFGSFAVTIAANVPRNERLARLPAESGEAQAYWRAYLVEWTRWNHVRTAASILAAACAAIALTR